MSIDEIVSLITLEVGDMKNSLSQIYDIVSVTELETEVMRELKLMGRTTTVGISHGYKLEIEYAIPFRNRFDFTQLRGDSTLSIVYGDGSRIVYQAVSTLTIGGQKYDGEGFPVQKILLLAESKSQVS